MKKITTIFYVFLIIIIAGIFLFFFLEKGEKIRITYFIQKEQGKPISEDSSLIYQEMLNHTELSIKQFDYGIKLFENIEDLEKKLKDTIKSGISNVFFCSFADEESFNAFLTMDSSSSPFYITVYDGDLKKANTKKEILHIYPPTVMVAEAVNAFFNLNDNHSNLIINDAKNHSKNTAFLTHLKGKNNSVSLDENDNFNDIINSLGKTLSEINPDYLIIDLTEKNTITLLEKIVGYPRDRIILLIQNTSEQVGYYTGSNSFGVNGIAFSNPSEVRGFNNKDTLLKMITRTLAQCFVKYNKVGIEELKKHLGEVSGESIQIKDNNLITPLYKISFSEKGLRVVSKLEMKK